MESNNYTALKVAGFFLLDIKIYIKQRNRASEEHILARARL
jgi:hypothetical protein